MKLVYIIAGLNTGGAESFLTRLSRELKAHHSIQVISLSSMGQLSAQLLEMGISVTALEMRRGRFSIAKFLHLIQIIKAADSDVVHTWMYHACLVGGVATRLARARNLIWSIHHSNLSRAANKTSTLFVIHIVALLSWFVPDRIVYVANAARKIHERIGYAPHKGAVIFNGFDIAKFREDAGARASVRKELGISDGIPLVGIIGRFDVQKGHAIFVKVAANLLRRLPNARFLLVGKGVDEHNEILLNWLWAEQIQSSIFLFGYRTDINRLIAGIDVLFMPSIGEAFPNVVGEAMSTGIPCVGTDVGDTAMLMDDAGFIGPPRDVARLTDLLQQMLAMTPQQRRVIGARGRARIEKCFRLDMVVKQYADLYQSVR